MTVNVQENFVQSCSVAAFHKQTKNNRNPTSSYKSPSLSCVPPKGTKRLLLIITPNNSSASTKNSFEKKSSFEVGYIEIKTSTLARLG